MNSSRFLSCLNFVGFESLKGLCQSFKNFDKVPKKITTLIEIYFKENFNPKKNRIP